MTRLLLIFGAGASRGSVSEYSVPGNRDAITPLTSDLFDHPFSYSILSAESQSLTGSIEEIKRKLKSGSTVEGLLEDYHRLAQGGNDERRVMLEDLSWYLARLLFLCSAKSSVGGYYDSLLNYLNDIHIDAFACTFNYDTLFERALARVHSVRIEQITQYLDIKVPLIKLHGSWNWKKDGIATSVIPDDIGLESCVDRILRPELVLGLPINGTKNFLCPLHHLMALRDFVTKPFSVLTVGWSGNEPHFFNELVEMNPVMNIEKLIVVCNDQSGCNVVVGKFLEVSHPTRTLVFTKGFSQFVTDEMARLKW